MPKRAQNGIDANGHRRVTVEDRSEVDRRGQAIMETDGSVVAVIEVMRGCPPAVFGIMDNADNHYPVPEWHCHLRAARNASYRMKNGPLPSLFDVIWPEGGAR